MPKVFVSYARDESKKVYGILAKLEQHGIKFWVDTRDIKSGKDWAEEISKAILRCRKFLLFMSHLSMASNNTSQEVKIASANGKKIILLRLDDVEIPNRLKYALQDIQWTDYSSRRWKSEIVAALGGNQVFFQKAKPAPSLPVHPPKTRSVPKRPPKAEVVIAQLQRTFSANRNYYPDRCASALTKLQELRLVVGSHWVNPALAYQELVPRVYLLEKVDLLQTLIQEFQETCPPGSAAKRQLILHELNELLQELNHKAAR